MIFDVMLECWTCHGLDHNRNSTRSITGLIRNNPLVQLLMECPELIHFTWIPTFCVNIPGWNLYTLEPRYLDNDVPRLTKDLQNLRHRPRTHSRASLIFFSRLTSPVQTISSNIAASIFLATPPIGGITDLINVTGNSKSKQRGCKRTSAAIPPTFIGVDIIHHVFCYEPKWEPVIPRSVVSFLEHIFYLLLIGTL